MSPSTRLRVLRSPAALMAAGMLVFAAAGYAFVVLAGRVLPKDQATLATSFYFLANVVGPGIFFALEQATSRATSAAIAGRGSRQQVTRRGWTAGLRLVGMVSVVLAALGPLIGVKTLHGDWALYTEVLLTPLIAVNLHFVRGLLAGRQRFGAYSATLAAEGGGRLVLCMAVAFGGASTAWIFGLAYIGATALAALIGFVALRSESAIPVTAASATLPEVRGFGKELLALALASLFSQLLPNLAPLAVNSRLDAGSALALTFAQAAVVARIPLLLFLPIQAMVLPQLTSAATRGDLAEVRTVMKKILAITVGLGVAGAAVFAATGSWALRTFFGATQDLSTATLLGLAGSTVILMATYALQPALVSLGLDPVVMAAWGTGSLITGGVAVLPFAAVPAATIGQIAGPATTTAVFAGAMALHLRARRDHSAGLRTTTGEAAATEVPDTHDATMAGM